MAFKIIHKSQEDLKRETDNLSDLGGAVPQERDTKVVTHSIDKLLPCSE
jgi:hypothetical protein